jgi:N-acetylneuraminic acid mutarotase
VRDALVDTILSSTEVHTIGSSGWTAGEQLPRAVYGKASVSFDNEVILIGNKGNIIIIILHSLAGSREAGGRRREILAYREGSWTEVGLLGIARSFAGATNIMVNTTFCN